jgi:hypothetical protein
VTERDRDQCGGSVGHKLITERLVLARFLADCGVGSLA